jgi:hypothetical protein
MIRISNRIDREMECLPSGFGDFAGKVASIAYCGANQALASHLMP